MPARIGLVGFLKKPEKNKTINKPQVHNAYRAEGTELYFLFLNKSIYFHLKCHIYLVFCCLYGKDCRVTFRRSSLAAFGGVTVTDLLRLSNLYHLTKLNFPIFILLMYFRLFFLSCQENLYQSHFQYHKYPLCRAGLAAFLLPFAFV